MMIYNSYCTTWNASAHIMTYASAARFPMTAQVATDRVTGLDNLAPKIRL